MIYFHKILYGILIMLTTCFWLFTRNRNQSLTETNKSRSSPIPQLSVASISSQSRLVRQIQWRLLPQSPCKLTCPPSSSIARYTRFRHQLLAFSQLRRPRMPATRFLCMRRFSQLYIPAGQEPPWPGSLPGEPQIMVRRCFV